MKIKLLSLLFICTSLFYFGQKKTIVKLLNNQIKMEKTIKQNDFEDDNVSDSKAFEIDQNGILQFSFTVKNKLDGTSISVNRKVPLEKITQFIKDRNVIFLTQKDAVVETENRFDEHGQLIKSTENNSSMFFTEINKESNNEHLRDQMLKAFRKAGYTIEGEYWYD